MASPNQTKSGRHAFQPPKGTRDFYPAEMARRRYIFETWRDAAIRHGFDEINGPTFEHLDLYTVKSGEGIVSELFSFKRAGGETTFALRPEFTPTLARMVAARANSLPKPIKWFSVADYFRAERPQRGRLREFAQWNVDVLGDDSAQADAECIACCVEALRAFGLSAEDVRIRVSHRGVVAGCLRSAGVNEDHLETALALLDKRGKIDEAELAQQAGKLGLDIKQFDEATRTHFELRHDNIAALEAEEQATDEFSTLMGALRAMGVAEWCEPDFNIVRGLAYYTGTVFEVHEAGGKERAIAGGGRYDKLVELFDGPPTPAVGFAMGDVVLGLVLQDKGLMPEGAALLDEIGARPDVFVIASGEEESERAARPLISLLRSAGLHTRHTYRATRNVGKLLKEADGAGARFTVIIEAAGRATVKSLESGEQLSDVSFSTSDNDDALDGLFSAFEELSG